MVMNINLQFVLNCLNISVPSPRPSHGHLIQIFLNWFKPFVNFISFFRAINEDCTILLLLLGIIIPVESKCNFIHKTKVMRDMKTSKFGTSEIWDKL